MPRFLQLGFEASTDGLVESLTSRTVSNVQILFRAASRAASGLTLSLADLNVGCCDCACCTEVGTGDPWHLTALNVALVLARS